MPNRIIKESIHGSESVNRMSDFQFRLWVNLITYVDDYGRGDARPAIIKGTCFPLRDRITNKDIDAALSALADIGCVGLYTVDGRPYLYLPNWESHQSVRNKKSRYPAPPAPDENCKQLQSIVINCVSESEFNPNTNPNPNPKECTEQAPLASLPPLPLNDGSEYHITVDQLAEWRSLYPAVDVDQELRNMRGWLLGNSTRRKTKSGIVRFITTWLSKEQDRGRKPVQQNQSHPAPASYDLDAAETRFKTSVPRLTKRETR